MGFNSFIGIGCFCAGLGFVSESSLVVFWDFSGKNNVEPSEVTLGSRKKVWWVCGCWADPLG